MCSQIPFKVAAEYLTGYDARRLLRVPPSPSEVPKRWFNFLKRKVWFRRLIFSEYIPPQKERKLPYVLGPSLVAVSSETEATLKWAEYQHARELCGTWRGRKVEKDLPETFLKAPKKRVWARLQIRRGKGVPDVLWYKPVLDAVKILAPHILTPDTNRKRWIITPHFFRPYLPGDWIKVGDVLTEYG